MRLYIIFMVTCTAGNLWALPRPSPSSSAEDLKMEARVDDDMEDYGAPGFLPFHNGEAFTVEKDPNTGTLDFSKKETPDYGTFFKDDIDRKDARPKIQPYHTPNDIPSNPFKISAVDSSPDLHQFLNLPVHYSTSGKFPLISSSYANMKVQGSSSGSNHKHYTPATTTSTTTTSRPSSFYTSPTVRSTSNQPAPTSIRTTTLQERPSTTRKPTTPSTTTTTSTTPKPVTKTTTTEKMPPKIIPQQVWNISEPVDYLPEEEISYVDYEYEPETVNQFIQQNGHGSQHQQNFFNQQESHTHQDLNKKPNTKDTNVGANEKLEHTNKYEPSPKPTPISSSTTTVTTPTTETTPRTTSTTSKVSIITSAPISITPSVVSSSTPKTKEPNMNQYSTSMPVSASEEAVRPGVGNTYLFSGNVAEESLHGNNINNFFRPMTNEGPFKPMPAMNESVPYINQRPEPDNLDDYSYDQRQPMPPKKTEKPAGLPQNTYQQQRPQNVRPNIEPMRPEPPFPFENIPPQFQGQNQYPKPNRPPQTEQPRPEKTQYDQRPHINQNQYQQNNKNERPYKHPASESNSQETFSVEVGSNLYQVQNQFNKPDGRPNKYPQTTEPHQPFDVNVVKHTPNQFSKQPQQEISPQTQFTAHLSTGPISHIKRPQNSNIHPSDLRPPPPPIYQNLRPDGQDEEANLVKKPLPSKPVKISSSIKPISNSGGFVNIQPGKIQNMVPIRIPTEVDQNSQSYSLQTSFSIGAGGDENRHPVAHGSVIDENISNINRSEIIPPSHHVLQQQRPERPQRPQNIRPPPSNQAHHWESYSPHHYPNNKVKTDSEVLKPNLPNILPQFRPNAKVGHVEPNTQYVERVKQPLEHLQPPPLPRPQYLRIDRNDEEVQESMIHQQAKQSMRVFSKQQPTGNKVTTLQMMQQGQSPPSVPLKRIIRTESKPHSKFQEKQHKPIVSHTIQEKADGGSPVHVVYPTTNQRLTPNFEDVVVVGTHGVQRPSPPNNLQHIDDDPFPLDDSVPFLLSERDRDTPILKTKPNKPLKNDFPYSLVKHNDLLDVEENKVKQPINPVEENKIAQEYTAFSPTESTNKKIDPDTELNVIPYLQDYSPYATRKPPHAKPISVTLKNVLAHTTPKSNLGTIERVEIKPPPSSSKQKYSSGNQEFTVGAMIDMLTGNHKNSNPVQGFVQQVNMSAPNQLSNSKTHSNNVKNHLTHASHSSTPLVDVQTQDFQAPFQPSLSNPENQGWRVIGNITREYPEEKVDESETTVKPTDFSFEQFKPQLFGGFKPIVPSESEEEEMELDA